MMLANSNKDLYRDSEFSNWLNNRSLIPAETYLISKYLDPQLTTVEAGTNGGRILLGMQAMGYKNLSGFDYVPELIDRAIEQDTNQTIDFQVQDATKLDYPDCRFDQIIYLMQILCTLENQEDSLKAVRESYRILKPGGIGLFSVLNFEIRNLQPIFSIYYQYLKLLRKLRGDRRSVQSSPWFRLSGKFNFGTITDRPPYTYWYRVTEIYELLRSVGFEIVGIGTDPQIDADNLKHTDLELLNEEISGTLYVVVKKSQ
jgi:SAM-dependent methyltransferase